MTPVVVQIAGVSKDYHGLRPLRIQQLVVAAGESVAIVGFDRISAEVFVNLVTGATLPDAGSIALFGRPTAEISDSAEWLALVDRFGIVSDRAVLLEQLTVVQNLAMPFTLDIEPPPDAVRVRAERLAGEVGLDERTWTAPVAEIGAPAKTRVRVGRALALDPAVLLLEHASAGLERAAAASLARDVRAAAERRGAAVITATADDRFARDIAARVLKLEPATGRLKEERRGWFRRFD